MAEKHYTNREMDMIVKDLSDGLRDLRESFITRNTEMRSEMLSGFEVMDRRQRDGFDKITGRQDVANGRTSKLEKWMYTVMGATATFLMIILPFLSWSLLELMDLRSAVEQFNKVVQ